MFSAGFARNEYLTIGEYKSYLMQEKDRMIDIRKLKNEIVEALLPLKPAKIILFGSYAYGTPTEESDIDLFLLKDDLDGEELKYLSRNARKKLVDLTYKYSIGFDILTATQSYLSNRDDYFYKVDILQNGKVLYE